MTRSNTPFTLQDTKFVAICYPFKVSSIINDGPFLHPLREKMYGTGPSSEVHASATLLQHTNGLPHLS